MIDVLQILGGVFLVAGLVLGVLTNRHRNEGAPRLPSFNPKHWVPWAVPDLLTKKGMKVYLTSYSCTMFGLALIGIARILMSC